MSTLSIALCFLSISPPITTPPQVELRDNDLPPLERLIADAADFRGSLRTATVLVPESEESVLLSTALMRKGDGWSLFALASPSHPSQDRFAPPQPPLWWSEIGAFPEMAPDVDLWTLPSSLYGSERLVVSSRGSLRAIELDPKTGQVILRRDGWAYLDVERASASMPAAALLMGKGGAIGWVEAGEGASGDSIAKLQVEGTVLCGTVLPGDSKQPRTDSVPRALLVTSKIQTARGGERPRTTIEVSSLVSTSEGGLTPAGVVLEVSLSERSVAFPQRADLLVSGSAAFLLLPNDRDRGGSIVHFRLGSNSTQRPAPESFIMDPDGKADLLLGYPDFGDSGAIANGLLIVGRPGQTERSAIFAFDVESHELVWRLDYEPGMNVGTHVEMEDPETLLICGGGMRTLGLYVNGCAMRYAITGRRQPVLIERVSQQHLGATVLGYLESSNEDACGR